PKCMTRERYDDGARAWMYLLKSHKPPAPTESVISTCRLTLYTHHQSLPTSKEAIKVARWDGHRDPIRFRNRHLAPLPVAVILMFRATARLRAAVAMPSSMQSSGNTERLPAYPMCYCNELIMLNLQRLSV